MTCPFRAVAAWSGLAAAMLVFDAAAPARADQDRMPLANNGSGAESEYRAIPQPPSSDDAVSATFMDRALSFYAAQEKYRRTTEGRVSFVNAAIFTTVGSLWAARAKSRLERVEGGSWALFGAANLVNAFVLLGSESELEELEADYRVSRKDGSIPPARLTNRTRLRWRSIASHERAVRKTYGWAGLVIGLAFRSFAIYEASAAQDDVTRWGALNVAVMSMLVTGTSASMLTNPTPAEEGYRAWLVYVEPLPADSARSNQFNLVGGRLCASGLF